MQLTEPHQDLCGCCTPGRAVRDYLALPVSQYSLLDPEWVTRCALPGDTKPPKKAPLFCRKEHRKTTGLPHRIFGGMLLSGACCQSARRSIC